MSRGRVLRRGKAHLLLSEMTIENLLSNIKFEVHRAQCLLLTTILSTLEKVCHMQDCYCKLFTKNGETKVVSTMGESGPAREKESPGMTSDI